MNATEEEISDEVRARLEGLASSQIRLIVLTTITKSEERKDYLTVTSGELTAAQLVNVSVNYLVRHRLRMLPKTHEKTCPPGGIRNCLVEDSGYRLVEASRAPRESPGIEIERTSGIEAKPIASVDLGSQFVLTLGVRENEYLEVRRRAKAAGLSVEAYVRQQLGANVEAPVRIARTGST